MSVMLCADTETLKNPEFLGIHEQVFDRDLIDICASGEATRAYVRQNVNLSDVWVAGSDDIDALNLAATLLHDRPELKVRLISNNKSGSLVTRAEKANISDVLDVSDFAKWYYQTLSAKTCNTSIKPEAGKENSLKSKGDALKANKEISNFSGNCWVACVVGTGGGCGKSSVAATFASLVSALQKRTLLVDADIAFGDIASMMHSNKVATFTEVNKNLDLLGDFSQVSDKGIPSVLLADEHIEEAENEKALIPGLIDEARKFYDCIVINTGSVVDELLVDLIEKSSANIVVLDQRQGSISNLQKLRSLISRMNMSEQTFKYVLNKVEKHSLFRPSDIESALQTDSVFGLDDGGEVVEELLSKGEMLTLLEDKNPFAKSIFELICSIYPPCMSAKKSRRN